MSLALAEHLLQGVREAAASEGTSVAAAVVDRGGQVVAVARMDGTPVCGVPLAIDKAFSAAAMAAPTDAWAQSTTPGGADWGMSTALGGRMVVYPGGLPLFYKGELLGGLGVSGAEGQQDKSYAAASARVAHLAESAE
ncbi:MAG: GlcG/HbpS family heme-binding protein [Streptosporangiaceae bacterium]